MMARIQGRSGRQVILSTHSTDLLWDEGIGLDEVLLLIPGTEGTKVQEARSIRQIDELLQGGVSLAEAVMPWTRPPNAQQLTLFPG